MWGAFWPGWGWLGWVAPALFFLGLKGSGLKRGLLWGGLFGLLFFLVELSPILALWPFVGGLSLVAWLLSSLYQALFFALLGGAVGWGRSPFLWAGAWAMVEAARGVGPLGLSFGSLPAALWGQPFLAAAAWGGATLLSLGLAWTGAWLAKGLERPRLLPLALLGPALLSSLAAFAPQAEPTGDLKVALVQPNFPQEEKLNPAKTPQLLSRYEGLLSTIEGPVDLVVAPENALPAPLRTEEGCLAPFLEAAERLSCRVLVGSGELREEGVYNSALLLSPEGEVQDAYDMVRLVPFGEYIPGRGLWEALGLGPLFSRLLPFDLEAGKKARPLGDLGVMICFESQFAGLSRELVKAGAEVLIALTNDAWFGRTRLLWEHFSLGALRAAECGRSFLQAAQTGITGAVGPQGKLLAQLPPWKAGVLTVKVPLFSHETPWVKMGPWPGLGLAALSFALGLVKRPRHLAGPTRGGRWWLPGPKR